MVADPTQIHFPVKNSMNNTTPALDWVKPYYTTAGEYWGPAGIEDHHRERLAIMERLCGPSPLRVLELGAGTGEAAAVMADAGHSVVAVDFSPTRAPRIEALAQKYTSTNPSIQPREIDDTSLKPLPSEGEVGEERTGRGGESSSRKSPHQGTLTALEADFYDVSLDREFDVVCYWDGFGVGSDADQRRLLRRISSEWLKPGGSALIDIFSPYQWTLETGKELILGRNHESHRFKQRRRLNFDPLQGCFLDTWCPIDDETGLCDESRAITQKIRCYNPADLLLLLENTGLSLAHAEVNGVAISLDPQTTDSTHSIWQAWSYLAQLKPNA